MELSVFTEKLNKVDDYVHVVEEKVYLTNGVYEAELQHDNINAETVSVYTGSKLTGEQINTYALSTPSLASWKRIIRVYANVPEVYISYETTGDTVEADDINHVQASIISTQRALNQEEQRARQKEEQLAGDILKETERATRREADIVENLGIEIVRAQNAENNLNLAVQAEMARAEAVEKELHENMELHISSVDAELQALRQANADLGEQKADAEAVNKALAERYTKSQVYTKEEVLQKIEELIGIAPDTMNTFAEIANALGNDPNFATTIINLLTEKVDKESGKGLSSNDYSDTDKNNLADVNSKKHIHNNKDILDKITQILMDCWTDAYNKRHEHGNKSLLDSITSSLVDKWNTVSGKVDKVEGKGLSANDFTDELMAKLNGIKNPVQKGCTWNDLKGV